MPSQRLSVAAEVSAALAAGRPVVALESTLVAHGLPRPDNLAIARDIEGAVWSRGAVPATVAMLAGTACVGLDDAQLIRIATGAEVPKLSVRDLGPAAAQQRDGATTVAATAALAARAGVRAFATGGLGGVHREARETWDESADLDTLARTPIVVVCSGVKSILDVGATLERLETLGVPVLGYRTDRFPGFYRTDSGHRLDWTAASPAEVAAVAEAGRALGVGDRALVVANPLPPDEQLDPELHDRVLASGLAAASAKGVRGKAVTPFLLSWFHAETGGASLTANVRLVRRNAELAADIAVALATRP